ncbi:MAG: HAD family hydrolase [Chlorobiales bacterium]|jgi:FMN phosphatase YigB (HAD superfamily)|nr:HAD family hydrolase [Chlorobiales bacterium]
MKVVSLPKHIRGLVFDVDLTLYDSRDYYDSMEPLMTERLARELGKTVPEMTAELRHVQETYKAENGGRKLSIGNLFHRFGVSFEENVRWREELFQPEKYLSWDAALAETMRILAQHFKIAAASNNATSVVKRTLKVLGVDHFIPVVIGLDMSLESKPTMVPFRMASEMLDIPLNELVSIGDRMEIDIELPVANGMGGILVERMEDVYALPDILLS